MREAKANPTRKAPLKSFDDLRRELTEAPDYPERFIYPEVQFGAFYWIPDEDSCLGEREKHPWVIIAPFQPGRPTVRACPRTSSRSLARRGNELAMPGGTIEGLERDGVIILDRQQNFSIRKFAGYRLIGRLPEEWQRRLGDALRAEGYRIARESEAS